MPTAEAVRSRSGRPNAATDVTTLFCAAENSLTRRAHALFRDRLREARETGPFAREEVLTPELAEILLAQNPDNRPLKEANLNGLKVDIAEGRWVMNGETVIVAETGELNDGQHRCRAVVDVGRAIRTMISWGVARAARTTTDQGVARTTGDYLNMAGCENANVTAAVAGYLWQYERRGVLSTQALYRPTKQQVVEAVAAHPLIADSIAAVPRTGTGKLGGISIMVFAHYLFAQIDREAATDFIVRLVKGDGLGASDPIFALRERLLSERQRRGKLEVKAELLFRGWNAHRRGATMGKMVTKGGALPRLER